MGRVPEFHVVVHQRFHGFHCVIGKPQARQQRARDGHAQFHVAVESYSLRHAEGAGLPHVMQQHAQGEFRGRLPQSVEHEERVRPDIALGMVFRRLLYALHGLDLWKNLVQQTGLVQQFHASPRAALRQDANQFIPHAFRRYARDGGSQPADRFERALFNGETEPRGEAHGTKKAQMILPKARLRIADRADDAGLQIRPPVGVIQHLARIRIEQQGVNGEVAPLHVLARVLLEANALGMPPVTILQIAAKGGYLNLRAALVHQHDAEVRADLVAMRKQSKEFGGGRGGRDIEILRNPPQQQVPHAAAYKVSQVAGAAELSHDLPGQRRGTHGFHGIPWRGTLESGIFPACVSGCAFWRRPRRPRSSSGRISRPAI